MPNADRNYPTTGIFSWHLIFTTNNHKPTK
jgi:hypothetical protein